MASVKYKSTYPEIILRCHTDTSSRFTKGKSYTGRVNRVNAYGQAHGYNVVDDNGNDYNIRVFDLKNGHDILIEESEVQHV